MSPKPVQLESQNCLDQKCTQLRCLRKSDGKNTSLKILKMRTNFSVSQKSTCSLTNELGKVSANGKWKFYLPVVGSRQWEEGHLVCQSNKLLTGQRGKAENPAKRIRAASIFSSCPGQRRWRPNNHHHPIEKLWKMAAPRKKKIVNGGHWSGLEILRHWQNEVKINEGGGMNVWQKPKAENWQTCPFLLWIDKRERIFNIFHIEFKALRFRISYSLI